MFRKLLSGILVLVLSGACTRSADSGTTGKTEAKRSFSDFTLIDYNGVAHSLNDYKDAKAIVLMFIATRCPVSNAYNARMATLYADYHERGIAFVGINSNAEEDTAEIKQHASKNHLDFTILKDTGNVIADKFGATVTPEVFVMTNDLRLMYHGRIDDSRREANVKLRDLRHILNAILIGQPLSFKETKAFGCSIKRVKNDT